MNLDGRGIIVLRFGEPIWVGAFLLLNAQVNRIFFLFNPGLVKLIFFYLLYSIYKHVIYLKEKLID